MYKLKPYRRRSRKIGRNEPCPCGRMDQDSQELRPLKYKRCCGNIDNQRMMMAVRRHISNTIHGVVHGPRQTSKLKNIVNFLRGTKNESIGKF